MRRAAELWEQYSTDKAVRWPGIVALVALWLAIAFADGRFLLVSLIAGAGLATVLYRRRGEEPPASPDDDWF